MRILLSWGLLLLAGGLLLAGCTDFSNDPNDEYYYGSGNVVSQQLSVGTFTGIRLTNYGTVIITQSDNESLRIEVDDNLADRVTATVQSGVLHVGLKRGSYQNLTLRIHASMKTINSLDIIGAGEVSTTGPIHTNSITCTITGAGNITLAGTTTDQVLLITGAGNIQNFDLVSSKSTATISGAGNIELTATQSLSAVITGTGSIVYGGNPATVNKTVTGVGTIRPR